MRSQPLLSFLRNISRNHYMIRSLVVRDIRSRYVGSLLGIFWSVVHPLTQLVVYYFVFSMVFKVRLGPQYGGTHYVVWLLAGLLPWMLFAEIVTRASGAVLGYASLIKKMVFPSELLPLSQLAAAVVNHLITLGFLVLLMLWVEGGLPWSAPFFLVYLGAVGIFALGISWMLAALNVFLRDVGQVVGVAVNIWFYLTPVIYPKSLIPERFQLAAQLNPMYHVVEGYRAAFLGRETPDPVGLFYLASVGALCFIVGGAVFRQLQPGFADVL